MKVAAILLLTLGFSFSRDFWDCVQEAIDIEDALEKARPQVGKVYRAQLKVSQRSGDCYWSIRGTEGYLSIDALSGEVRFFKRSRRK